MDVTPLALWDPNGGLNLALLLLALYTILRTNRKARVTAPKIVPESFLSPSPMVNLRKPPKTNPAWF